MDKEELEDVVLKLAENQEKIENRGDGLTLPNPTEWIVRELEK